MKVIYLMKKMFGRIANIRPKILIYLFAFYIIIFPVIAFPFMFKFENSFFRGKVTSNYVLHFNDKIMCAYVYGWHGNQTKCMCRLLEEDDRLEGNITFLLSDRRLCREVE